MCLIVLVFLPSQSGTRPAYGRGTSPATSSPSLSDGSTMRPESLADVWLTRSSDVTCSHPGTTSGREDHSDSAACRLSMPPPSTEVSGSSERSGGSAGTGAVDKWCDVGDNRGDPRETGWIMGDSGEMPLGYRESGDVSSGEAGSEKKMISVMPAVEVSGEGSGSDERVSGLELCNVIFVYAEM